MLIETNRNEETANDHSMNTVTCRMPTNYNDPIVRRELVDPSTNIQLHTSTNFRVFTALTNNSFQKNDFPNNYWTQPTNRSVSLSISDTTNSSRSSSTCSSTFDNTTTMLSSTFRNVFNSDTFFTQQPTATQNISQIGTNSALDNLTIKAEGCTGCHFTDEAFVNNVNNGSSYNSYFHGDEITDLMLENSLSNVKIPATPPSFNVREESIINDGYNVGGYFMFDKLLKLCKENMSQQQYGVKFGSIVKVRLNMKDSRFPTTFTPFLIKLTTSKKNVGSSDQLSKCQSAKMNAFQKSNHLIGINIKPNTVTVFNSRSTSNAKIGFNFDEFFADGKVVWQYACIDHLQQKQCYRIACRDASKKNRQDKKQVKRNHILSLQTEKRNSSYIPILFLRKEKLFSKTIAKIQTRIYLKNLSNCSFELFATIE